MSRMREFQSLFYWNCRLITQLTISGWPVRTRFNPCFIGIAVWSSRKRKNRKATICFNPCFIGIAVWSPGNIYPQCMCWSFNPCFIGIAVWSARACFNPATSAGVSILVLLELPFDPPPTPFLPPTDRGFNPCFIGIAVWSILCHAFYAVALGFQSLFYWNCRLIHGWRSL